MTEPLLFLYVPLNNSIYLSIVYYFCNNNRNDIKEFLIGQRPERQGFQMRSLKETINGTSRNTSSAELTEMIKLYKDKSDCEMKISLDDISDRDCETYEDFSQQASKKLCQINAFAFNDDLEKSVKKWCRNTADMLCPDAFGGMTTSGFILANDHDVVMHKKIFNWALDEECGSEAKLAIQRCAVLMWLDEQIAEIKGQLNKANGAENEQINELVKSVKTIETVDVEDAVVDDEEELKASK